MNAKFREEFGYSIAELAKMIGFEAAAHEHWQAQMTTNTQSSMNPILPNIHADELAVVLDQLKVPPRSPRILPAFSMHVELHLFHEHHPS